MGGITPAELAAIRGRLEGFADDVFESLPRTDQRARGQCYLRGLLLEGRRKSIEPMAARLGEVYYQALHHFVASSPGTRGRSVGGWPSGFTARWSRLPG
jgi:SRSO17 transposase